jgi:hypothetical protein
MFLRNPSLQGFEAFSIPIQRRPDEIFGLGTGFLVASSLIVCEDHARLPGAGRPNSTLGQYVRVTTVS